MIKIRRRYFWAHWPLKKVLVLIGKVLGICALTALALWTCFLGWMLIFPNMFQTQAPSIIQGPVWFRLGLWWGPAITTGVWFGFYRLFRIEFVNPYKAMKGHDDR